MVTHSLWRGPLLELKTESSRAPVYLSNPLFHALIEHLEVSAFAAWDDFVFCRQDGSPVDPEFLRRSALSPALEEVGIKRLARKHGFHLYSLCWRVLLAQGRLHFPVLCKATLGPR